MCIPLKGLNAAETRRRNDIWRLVTRHGADGVKLQEVHERLQGSCSTLKNKDLTRSLSLQMVRNGNLRMQQPGSVLVVDDTCVPLPGFEGETPCV